MEEGYQLRRAAPIQASPESTKPQAVLLGKPEGLAALRAVIDDEDASDPLSDEKIAAKMKEAGIPVARRTVAKYRGLLGIGGVSERRALK